MKFKLVVVLFFLQFSSWSLACQSVDQCIANFATPDPNGNCNCPGCDLSGVTVTESNGSLTFNCNNNCGLPAPITVQCKIGAVNDNAVIDGGSFKGLDLTNADFTGVSAINTDLSNTILNGTSFCGANLTSTNLSGVKAKNAHFDNASFYKANLSNGVFTYVSGMPVPPTMPATFNCAMIAYSNLTGANFSGVNFNDLSGSIKLEVAKAAGANPNLPYDFRTNTLLNTNFSYATLAGLKFGNSNLSGVNFAFADLSNTDLSNTTLTGVNFECASLMDSNLTGATGRASNGYGVNLSAGNQTIWQNNMNAAGPILPGVNYWAGTNFGAAAGFLAGNGLVSFLFSQNNPCYQIGALQLLLNQNYCVGIPNLGMNAFGSLTSMKNFPDPNCGVYTCAMKGAKWAILWESYVNGRIDLSTLTGVWWQPIAAQQAAQAAAAQAAGTPAPTEFNCPVPCQVN